MADIEFYEWGYAYPSAARPALSGVNCVLHPTQFTLVIGESGAGKSTLVRAMNGLVPHFTGGRVTGRLRVAGLDPVSAGPSRMALHVGMVFQDPESQFVLDTVEDEVAFALENAAIPRPEMRRRVEETLGLLGISHLRQRTIHTLSGGEQQRVAIASALVLQPAILALDEPTSQLDPESAAGVLDALADLNRSGLAIVLVEHRLERVVPFANAVMRVEGGTAMVGPPAEMLNGSPIAPPTVELARALGLHPLPLTLPALVTALSQQSAHIIAQPTSDTLPAQHRTSIGDPILRLQGVCAAYGDRPVLYDIDLTAQEGEIIALIGRNGHGKSTLLKTIIGLVRPSAGAIWLDGKRIDNQDTTTISRKVAYLPQNPNALLFADTVQDELNITRRNHGLPTLSAGEVDNWLRRLRLAGQQSAFPRDLSVGERERVAIGAVTVTRPRLILLDEPTRGLDYTAKQALRQMLFEWQREGCAIIIVSHDVEFIATCATRAVLLREGRITHDDLPARVLTADPIFTPQIAQVFPGSGWLTVADAVKGLSTGRAALPAA